MTNRERKGPITACASSREGEMGVAAESWLDLMDREYLQEFVARGGSVIKFVECEGEQFDEIQGRLSSLAQQSGLATCRINAAQTKLHMIQDVFFAISRGLDWSAMAQAFVEALVTRHGYEWPRSGTSVALEGIATHNGVDKWLFRRELNRWLTEEIMRDRSMTQDFQIAMTQLCLTRLAPEDSYAGVTAPVLEWLRGELRTIGVLRQAYISARITRHNGRAMLRSLCRWLRLCGRQGLCLVLDIRRVLHVGAAPAEGLRYTSAAVIDAFEVLRQLIDDAETFEGL